MTPATDRPIRSSSIADLASLTLLAAGAILLQACIFSSKGGKGVDGKEYRGYYSIELHDAYDPLLLESSYKVTWFATKGPTTGDLEVGIRCGTYSYDKVIRVDTVRAETREFLWSLPATVAASDYTLGSRGGCKLRLTSLEDTSKWDVSREFSLGSNRVGTFTLDAPPSQAYLMNGDSVRFQWSYTGNIGDTLGLRLEWKDTAAGPWMRIPVKDRGCVWKPPAGFTPRDTGYGYAFRLASLQNPDHSERSYVRFLGAFDGGFRFSAPDSDRTYAFGSSYRVEWTATGLPGRSASLDLSCQGSPTLRVRDTVPLNGSTYWVPAMGLPSTDSCALVLRSREDSALMGRSGRFSLGPFEDDFYENDDEAVYAEEIGTSGYLQFRTLTAGDEDWIFIRTQNGKRYVIAGYSSDTLEFAVLDNNSNVMERPKGREFHVKVGNQGAGRVYLHVGPGRPVPSYSLAVKEFDSTATGEVPAVFQSPTSSTLWIGGSADRIQWNPDTLFFGKQVRFILYDGKDLIGSLTPAPVANSGNFRPSLTGRYSSTAAYRVRMESALDPDFFAHTPYFRISSAPAAPPGKP